MISLQGLITDDTNLIEMYITSCIENCEEIDIRMDNIFITKIKEEFKNFTNRTNKYVVYFKNDLSYTYDSSNDNQIVSSKNQELVLTWNKKMFDVFAISFKYSKLPTYQFPCINLIDHKTEYTIYEIKLTNRINLIIKNDKFGNYVYLEYKHSPQVEIEKIETIINKTIDTLSNIYIRL